MLKLLQSAGEIGRCLRLCKQGGQRAVTALQLMANLKQLCRSGKIIPDVMSAIEQRHKLVPSGARDCRRTRKVRVNKYAPGSLCDFRLDRFAEKQARQKPFEQFFLIFRCKVDSQTERVGGVLGDRDRRMRSSSMFFAHCSGSDANHCGARSNGVFD